MKIVLEQKVHFVFHWILRRSSAACVSNYLFQSVAYPSHAGYEYTSRKWDSILSDSTRRANRRVWATEVERELSSTKQREPILELWVQPVRERKLGPLWKELSSFLLLVVRWGHRSLFHSLGSTVAIQLLFLRHSRQSFGIDFFSSATLEISSIVFSCFSTSLDVR